MDKLSKWSMYGQIMKIIELWMNYEMSIHGQKWWERDC